MHHSPILEKIWIKPSRKGPMKSVESACTQKDTGLEGNAEQGGKRQVTIIEKEVFDRIRNDLGDSVDPIMRRANLLVSGVELKETKGRVLKIGDLYLRIEGETKPCSRMEEAFTGLREALVPNWGGGIYGIVLNDATISRGDSVVWVDKVGSLV